MRDDKAPLARTARFLKLWRRLSRKDRYMVEAEIRRRWLRALQRGQLGDVRRN